MSVMTHETRVHARSLVAYGEGRPDAVVLSADLTSSTEADSFRDAFPHRFISMGMAEQNMMSFAGGLVREGLRPLVHDFAVFMYRRSLDQIEMSIAYPSLPVSIVGFLPGLTTPGGASHQAVNDVAVMRSIPNMAIIETGDVTDVEGALHAAEEHTGPVYLRMIRGNIPRLFDTPLRFRKARILREGTDVLVVSSGICTEDAIEATQRLVQSGVEIGHAHVSTLKPFDDAELIDRLLSACVVVTVENHSTIGGLGSAVAEVLATHGAGAPLHRMGIDDTYSHGASRDYLVTEHGIDADAIAQRLAGIVGLKSVQANRSTPVAQTNEDITTPDEAL